MPKPELSTKRDIPWGVASILMALGFLWDAFANVRLAMLSYANITDTAELSMTYQLISSGERWGRGPTKDIHSSLHAIVDSPAWRLVKALDTLVKEDGHTPAVEGWFENVKPLTARQKELMRELAGLCGEQQHPKAAGFTGKAKKFWESVTGQA